MSNSARRTAWSRRAPLRERTEARTELQREALPPALQQLIPAANVLPVVNWIREQMVEEAFTKSLQAKQTNVIEFPGSAVRNHRSGMQSVYLDDMQINIQGDFYERPTAFGFDAMRAMVDQTPILSGIVFTRIRQVSTFCHVNNDDDNEPGFRIRLREKGATADSSEQESITAVERFFLNCGWESRPRHRMRLKRDNFATFMAKAVRDSLTMDSTPIETEWKRDRSLGLDGFYAVDGATIRLCTEEGYRGDDEIFALQVVQGNIRTAYTYNDLVYVPRNPRSDVVVGGYGLGETELLLRTVTGFLNAFTYNTSFFDRNSIPRGIINLVGNYDKGDLESFKRYFRAMVNGAANHFALPVMASKDADSKATFEPFGDPPDDVMFSKWMTFLTSIACAIYTIDPGEINMESFSSDKSSLSGSDTKEKLAASRDKGLVPLLEYFANLFNEFIVQEWGEKYVFEWTGLKPKDPDRDWEAEKLVLSVNELRAKRGEGDAPGDWGDAPLNPALITGWQGERDIDKQQQMQQDQMDFGTPGMEQPGAGQDADFGDEEGGGVTVPGDPSQLPPDDGSDAFAKSFGLPKPVYTVK